MSNIKNYTIEQLCSDLTKAFGEDYTVAEVSADKKNKTTGRSFDGILLYRGYHSYNKYSKIVKRWANL